MTHPSPPVIDRQERERSLQEIGNILAYWLKWVTKEHGDEGREVTADTHIMFGYDNAPPHWPSIGQLKCWLEVIRATPSVVIEDEVERVARAVEDADEAWFEIPPRDRIGTIWESLARAALAASDRDVLVAALCEARTIVASDAAACKAFAGPGETSEPERVLAVIDAALIPLGGG